MKKLRKLFPSRAAMLLLMTMLTSVGAWASVPATTPESWKEAGGTGGSGTDSNPYYVNMPKKGTATTFESAATLNVPNDVTTFKLYDDGGKNGDYSNQYTGYLVITAPTGYVINLSGSIVTYSESELTVYNGDTSGTKLLDKIYGNGINVSATSTDNVITVYFYSNGNWGRSGLDLTATIAKLNDLQLATITGVESRYSRTSSAVSINPTVTAGNNTQLTLGTHFTATLNGSDVNEFPFEVNDAGDYTLTVTGKGDYIGSKSVSFHMYTLGGITYDNDGGYYIMDEAQDFEDLAAFVNVGYNCDGLTFKMTGNVQFGDGTGTGDANHTPIGSDNDHSFRGTFDGQDNTISGLIVNTSGNAGLFGYTRGTIQNVTIENSSITSTNGNYTGAIAGFAGITNDTNYTVNCHVKSTVTISGANYAGGIAGYCDQRRIEDSSSAASVSGTNYVGGISGKGYKVINCIYTGISLTGGTNMGTIVGTISDTSDITNCFTTNAMESAGSGVNGTLLQASIPANGLYYAVTISGVTGYANYAVSNLHTTYLTDGTNPVDIVPVVKDAADNTFTAGTDYTVSYSPNAFPIAAGNYTMTLTGASANCSGSYTHDFTLVAQTFTGSGTQESPYLIATTDQLVQVAQYVNNGSLGSGSSVKYYKLTADLDFEGKTFTPIGTNENRFNGVFDGQSHKISNVTLSAYEAGLFCYTENATVKNLYLDNCDFTNTGGKAGCVAANVYSSIVENCHVSNTVNFTAVSSRTGGIVGYAKSSTIRGCTSAYNVTGSSYCGGIIGEDDKNEIYENLYYGTQLTGNKAVYDYTNWSSGYQGQHHYRNLTTTSYTNINDMITHAYVISSGDDLNAIFEIESGNKGESDYGNHDLKAVWQDVDTKTHVYGIYFGGKLYIRDNTYYTVTLSPIHTGYTSITYYKNTTSVGGPNGENDTFYSTNNSGNLNTRWNAVYGITLADDADNSAVINEFDGSVCNVTLSGHKFYQDRDWNTICLPFDFDVTCNENGNSQIGLITVKGLDAENSNLDADGKLTLAFTTESHTIKAGKPYIVKWPSGSGDILENPTITGVTIDKTECPVSFTNNKTTSDCQFVGNYAPLEITDANRNDILLLAAGNKLGYAKTDRTLGAFRAYFNIPTTTNAPAISSYVLNFGDEEGETTGIVSIDNGKLKIDNEADTIYDLQGRKVANPTKGLYIVNGKKVVIK